MVAQPRRRVTTSDNTQETSVSDCRFNLELLLNNGKKKAAPKRRLATPSDGDIRAFFPPQKRQAASSWTSSTVDSQPPQALTSIGHSAHYNSAFMSINTTSMSSGISPFLPTPVNPNLTIPKLNRLHQSQVHSTPNSSRQPLEFEWSQSHDPNRFNLPQDESAINYKSIIRSKLPDLRLESVSSYHNRQWTDPTILEQEFSGTEGLGSNGVAAFEMDFRKQCRRASGNSHCAQVHDQNEQHILVLASIVELLIAKNVFGVRVTSTVGFTRAVAGNGIALDAINTWDPSLLGHIYRVPWHPGRLGAMNDGSSFRRMRASILMQAHILPIVQDLFRNLGVVPPDSDCLHQFTSLIDWYKSCGSFNLNSLFNPNLSPTYPPYRLVTLPKPHLLRPLVYTQVEGSVNTPDTQTYDRTMITCPVASQSSNETLDLTNIRIQGHSDVSAAIPNQATQYIFSSTTTRFQRPSMLQNLRQAWTTGTRPDLIHRAVQFIHSFQTVPGFVDFLQQFIPDLTVLCGKGITMEDRLQDFVALTIIKTKAYKTSDHYKALAARQRRTEKAKATRDRWMKSERGKALFKASVARTRRAGKHKVWKRRYEQSDKGKAATKRYKQSEKGRIVSARAQKKFRQSEKGKESSRKTAQSEKRKAWTKQWQQSEKGKASRKAADARFRAKKAAEKAAKKAEEEAAKKTTMVATGKERATAESTDATN
ncbi:hypothetical protein PT974_01841 [Cladobotryum mycophilum]|uniref:Uncharacterized protein n=1 Tax=Cladobotryum mycophilum TaxID=491253 RepID=A0ABR0SWF6_9HYPO